MRAADSGFDEYLLWHAWHTEDKGSRYADPTYDLNGKLVREQKGAYGPDLFVGYINDFVERNREWPTTITLAGRVASYPDATHRPHKDATAFPMRFVAVATSNGRWGLPLRQGRAAGARSQ